MPMVRNNIFTNKSKFNTQSIIKIKSEIMKTKLFLLFSAIVFSMSVHAQNSIEVIDPPTTVVGGDEVTFTLSYEKTDENPKAWALIRFKSPEPNSENLEQGFASVTDNSGTVSVTVKAPTTPGVGYILQMQLFTANWGVLDSQDKPGITVTEPNNYITITNPPSSVIGGSFIDITFDYKTDTPNASAYIRFKNSGNLTEASVAVPVGAGTKTVSLEIPAGQAAGSGYGYQAQLFDVDGGWSVLAEQNLVDAVTYLADPNTVGIVDPPSKVTVGSTVDFDVNYTKDTEIASAYVLVRFTDSEGNLEQSFVEVTENSGTVQVSVEAPSTLGSDFGIQAQLYTTGWAELATENYEGVIVEEESPYSIAFVSPETIVAAGESVDYTVTYTKDDAEAIALVYMQFLDANGDVVEQADQQIEFVSENEATIQLSIVTPTAVGSSYSIQAQIASGSTADVLYTETIGGVIVEGADPNTVTFVEASTTAIAGKNVDITFDYTKSVLEDEVWAFVRFKEGSANVEGYDVSKKLSANSGTETLSLPIPPDALGEGYGYQIQLFTTGWDHLVTADLTGVSVEEYVPTGENTLEIVETSTDPINNGDIRTVSVKYNTLQTSIILVEIHSAEVATSETKIGQVYVELPAGNDTIELDLVVDKGHPGDKNKIQALLFTPGWAGISIPEIPYIVVDKGDGTITYRGQPYDENQNSYFWEALGDGYYSNYYIATGWEGPLKMNFGPVGSPSWIEYANENSASDSHKEFDIKIQKFSWHQSKDSSVDRGFPRAIDDINFPINTSMNGQWSEGSGGKGQINMTAWVTEDGNMSGKRSDIIVHAFHNGGNLRKKYDDNLVAEGHEFNNIGEFTANNGLTYQILRTLPGYLGEVASYNLVPDSIVQEDPTADYPTEAFTAIIDMKDIIDNLIAKEAAYAGTKAGINATWEINGLEWTVVGQSQSTVDGVAIANGHGKFTFNSYKIPDITDVGLSRNEVDVEFGGLTIFPNPFKDSFTFKTGVALSDSVSVELFTIDGRKVASIEKNDSFTANGGTVDTSNLSKGLYLVRIVSGNAQGTKMLMKN